MAQISSYPILDPQLADKVLGSNTVDSVGAPVLGNPTVQYTFSSIKSLVDQNFFQQLQTQSTVAIPLAQAGDTIIFGTDDITGSHVIYTAATGKVTFNTKGSYYIEQEYLVSGTPPGQVFPVFKTEQDGSNQVGPTIAERWTPNASTDRKRIAISNIVNITVAGTYYLFKGLWDAQGAQPTLQPQLINNDWAAQIPSASLKIYKLI
jgi:hypothetical protein